MLKKFCVEFEGVDRSGKELVRKYVDQLGKHKYVLMDRGLLSNIAYAELYDRDDTYEYDLTQFKDWTIVYLEVNEEDWKIRCKLTNEIPIDYKANIEVFEKAIKVVEAAGIKVLRYNTSLNTPYIIAKDVLKHLD